MLTKLLKTITLSMVYLTMTHGHNYIVSEVREIVACEFYEDDLMVDSASCPKDYTCTGGSLDVTHNNRSCMFKFCEMPFTLTIHDACSVEGTDGHLVHDLGDVVCADGSKCDAGPLQYKEYKLYFCGNIPKYPSYIRDMHRGFCAAYDTRDNLIEKQACSGSQTCSYGPIQVQDDNGWFDLRGMMNLMFCAKNPEEYSPLDVFNLNYTKVSTGQENETGHDHETGHDKETEHDHETGHENESGHDHENALEVKTGHDHETGHDKETEHDHETGQENETGHDHKTEHENETGHDHETGHGNEKHDH